MSGRTYGRTTGWAIIGGEAVRIRLGLGGTTCPDGTTGLYVYPYTGEEADAVLIPANLTRRTKAEALALLEVTK